MQTTEWRCMCGTPVEVPADRVVPQHHNPDGSWCAVSGCTLAPRVLEMAR